MRKRFVKIFLLWLLLHFISRCWRSWSFIQEQVGDLDLRWFLPCCKISMLVGIANLILTVWDVDPISSMFSC